MALPCVAGTSEKLKKVGCHWIVFNLSSFNLFTQYTLSLLQTRNTTIDVLFFNLFEFSIYLYLCICICLFVFVYFYICVLAVS